MAVYKCNKCPGYCCSYPVIPLKKRDVERLAEHFGLSFKDARRKFTKVDGDEPYAMRRKEDVHFGRICRFFDTKERRCTVYEARPVQCRTWPFWPENVESPEDWEHVTQICPGSGKGRHYSADEIITSIRMTRT